MFGNTPGFSARGSESDTQLTARFRWEDNIRTYLQETKCEGVEWIQLDQDTD